MRGVMATPATLKTFLVEWRMTSLIPPSPAGWVKTALDMTGCYFGWRGRVLDEVDAHTRLQDAAKASGTCTAVVEEAAKYTRDVLGDAFEYIIVGLDDMEDADVIQELRSFISGALSSGRIVCFCVTQSDKACMYLVGSIDSQRYMVYAMDAQRKFAYMHRALLVFLAACVTMDGPLTSLEDVDPKAMAGRLRERTTMYVSRVI